METMLMMMAGSGGGGAGGGNGYEMALQSFSMLPILFGLHYYHVTTTTTTEMPAATMCSQFSGYSPPTQPSDCYNKDAQQHQPGQGLSHGTIHPQKRMHDLWCW